MDPQKSLTTDSEAKSYMAEKEIPQLFESMMTGLMYARPANPIEFLEECISKSKVMGPEKLTWDSFALKKDPLPPISPRDPQREQSFITQKEEEQTEEKKAENTQASSSLNPYNALPPIKSEADQPSTGEVEESTPEPVGILAATLPPEIDLKDTKFTLEKGKSPVLCVLIGTVGCGKEHHFASLKDDFGLAIIRLGDLLDQEVKSGSEVGNSIKDMVNAGEQIPDNISVELIKAEMSKVGQVYGYVIDGFPRSIEGLSLFEEQVGAVTQAVYFEQNDDSLQETLEESTHKSAEEDIASFKQITQPIISHFEEHDKLFRISSDLGEWDQWEAVKAEVAKLGFVSVAELSTEQTEANVLGEAEVEPEEGEVKEDEIAAVEDVAITGMTEDSVPPSELNGTAFVCLIGSSTADSSAVVSFLEDSHDFKKLKVSDVLSAEAQTESPLGAALKTTMLQTQDIPHDMALAAILGAVLKHSGSEKILLEGFPRSTDQLEKFEKVVGPLSFAVFLEEESEDMKEVFKATSQLSEEEIEAEIASFKENVAPVLEHLESRGLLCKIPVKDFSTENESLTSCLADLKQNKLEKASIHELQNELTMTSAAAAKIPESADMKSVFEKLPIVFVTGGPGSGKGTQCDKIVKEFQFTHLSSGDLLRAKVASGSPDGQELDEMMKAGKLVPLEKVLELITEGMTEAVAQGSCNGFLIDGYPREIEQGTKFEEVIKPCSLVIDFDVPDEVMVQRLIKRGETSGRQDDNEETIRARLQTYREATVPVAEYYEKQNKLVKIDANRDVDAVFNDVASAFSTRLHMTKKSIKDQLEKLPIVFVTGGPGSGKGTQCDKIVEKFQFTHLSSGDLLRAKVASGSPDGQELDDMMKAGKLVPLEKVLDLITEGMTNAVAQGTCNGFLIDGYPREIEQGTKFEEKIKPCSLVIDFDVPDEVMVQRLIKRGETSGRQDDNEETIRARLQTYREATVPVAEYYEKQNKLVKVDANRDVEQVFADVTTAFKDKLSLGHASTSDDKLAALPIIFVTGGPGSGKGTQCDKIVSQFNFTHLSSGDLLRAKVASGSPDGQELDGIMKAGQLVPLEKVLDLITEAMKTAVEQGPCQGFLIDGYPREIEQGTKFEEKIKPCSLVIDFDVPDEVMVERLIKRGETSGRQDDNEETIRARLQTYREATVPVAEYYEKQNKLVKIDANRSVDEVFEDVVKAFATIEMAPVSQPVFFIVGGPGSGKGTQCEKMVAEFSLTHLSSGDLLRAEVASGSEKGKALEAAMKAGQLVTTETVLDLMKGAMEKEKATSKGYLIDGYPRKVEQGEQFEKTVAPCAACIFFDVPNEVMKERLLKRAETSGRADDNEETIAKRLVTFDNETKPVLSYYEKEGKLHKINAQRGVDEIYTDVRTVLLKFVK